MLYFDYHYGNEADMYAYYQFPKALVKHEHFWGMSDSARVLFGLMLDRLSLSLKNDWKDSKNRVYIYYTLEHIQEDLHCAHGKAVKLLSELESIGLIDRVKQGQGRPTRIYVKKFILPEENDKKPGKQYFPKDEAQTSDNKKSRLPKTGKQGFRKDEPQTSDFEKPELPQTGSADLPKAERNYNDFNELNLNDTEINQSSPSAKPNATPAPKRTKPKTDGQDEDSTDDTAQRIEAYRSLIKDNISYNDLVITRRFDIQLIDDFIEIMVDVILTVGKYVRINGEDKPRELVKSAFMKIGYEDMEHAVEQFKGVTERISKKRQYIVTLLYNCKLEMDSHYTNLVKSDMYG